MKKKKLGEVLQERGQITARNLDEAMAEQQGKAILLGEVLLERGLVHKGELISALEEIAHIPYVDCTDVSPDSAVLNKIPLALARKCLAFPIAQQGSKLIVVMADPQNLAMLDEIKFTAGTNVSPRFGFRAEILKAIAKRYGSAGLGDGTAFAPGAGGDTNDGVAADMEFISTSTRQANRDAIQEAQAELRRSVTPAVKIVCEVIRAATEKRASDIHIEPQAKDVVIRLRVDGMLRDLRREPRAVQNTLLSRIKILADMDIAERRTPQDGRFMVRIGPTSIDMRVSSLPTQYGEKIVMRLLNPETALLNFSELSMPVLLEHTLREVLALPQGMLLVTGPTGSGKTTTLYAALNLIRQPTVNVVTVEDPVEYVLQGINQVHVNNRAGFTFASCLRSILRQDPNVIMIGEIRDKETAEIAMKAAQTGHLVLSTLHTNDSLSAVTRLLDLGVPGFMIASSVTAILGQRLVRKLCACKRQVSPTEDALEHLTAFGNIQPMEHLWVPAGCEACDHTGYHGRIGIYELLMFDDLIREAVRSGETSEAIRGMLRNLGMKIMQEDALDKVRDGVTSLEEVTRVVPVQPLHAAECSACGRKIVRAFLFCPYCGFRQAGTLPAPGRLPTLPDTQGVGR